MKVIKFKTSENFLLLIALLFISLNGHSEENVCRFFFSNTASFEIPPPPSHALRWAESAIDKIGLYGIKDFATAAIHKLGLRPKYIYRGLGSIFVLRPDRLTLDREQLWAKSLHLHKLINQANGEWVSRDEKLLIDFLIRQLNYLGHHHNFNIYSSQSLGWAELTPNISIIGDQKDPWASSLLQGLQSLKFILKMELPKSKPIYRDNDTAAIGDNGVMTVFENGEIKPDQLSSLVHRVKYNGKWHWADGPIKKTWQPLLTFNQRAVEFLALADNRLTGNDLAFGIRKIYAEVKEEFP